MVATEVSNYNSGGIVFENTAMVLAMVIPLACI